MKRALLFILLISCFCIVALEFYFARYIEADDPLPEITLRYADEQPEDPPASKAARFFSELVYNKTGGRIQIKICSNAKLGDEQSVAEQVMYGGIDFARVSLLTIKDFAPSSVSMQLPFLYATSDEMWDALDGRIGEDIFSELEKAGIIGLSWYDAGVRSFYSSKPISSFEDMSALKVGIQENSILKSFIEETGACSAEMVYSDMYACFRAGIINSAENSIVTYQTAEHYLLAPYFYQTEHLHIPDIQIASSDTWNQISPEDQSIILRCAKESAQYERALWGVREREAENELKKAGCMITAVSPGDMLKFRQAAAAACVKLGIDNSPYNEETYVSE